MNSWSIKKSWYLLETLQILDHGLGEKQNKTKQNMKTR